MAERRRNNRFEVVASFGFESEVRLGAGHHATVGYLELVIGI